VIGWRCSPKACCNKSTRHVTRTQLVVTLDADTRVAEGADAELWLDSTRMHLFDPETGENLTHGRGIDARALALA
jgi:hypothetical protein